MKTVKVDTWGVTELEAFFTSRELPAGLIRIDSCTVVDDVQKFIQVEISIVRSHNGQYRYRPYWNRLQLLKCVVMM